MEENGGENKRVGTEDEHYPKQPPSEHCNDTKSTVTNDTIEDEAHDPLDPMTHDPMTPEASEVSRSKVPPPFSFDPRERVRELLMAKTAPKEICKAVACNSAYIYQVRRDMISELLDGSIAVEVICQMLGCTLDVVNRLKEGRDKLKKNKNKVRHVRTP